MHLQSTSVYCILLELQLLVQFPLMMHCFWFHLRSSNVRLLPKYCSDVLFVRSLDAEGGNHDSVCMIACADDASGCNPTEGPACTGLYASGPEAWQRDVAAPPEPLDHHRLRLRSAHWRGCTAWLQPGLRTTGSHQGIPQKCSHDGCQSVVLVKMLFLPLISCFRVCICNPVPRPILPCPM
jgi:hypothetical protein